MTIPEKVSAYIDRLVAEGKLRPGDRLPKYNDIAVLFKIPYVSVQRAFKSMEHAGKIKIVNGVGSFLNGGDALDVDFYVTDTTFDIPAFQKLVDEISQKNDLHLAISVKNKHAHFQSDVREHKVVISESDPWMRMDGCMMDYSFFEDYPEVVSKFRDFGSGGNMNLQLPFYMFTYQGIVNTKLLDGIGMNIDEISDLSYWRELAEKCRKHAVAPAALSVIDEVIWNFPLFHLSAILMLQERPDPEKLFKIPFYNTPTGRRIFDIAADCLTVRSSEWAFAEGKMVMDFPVGSWFTVQSPGKFHMADDTFRVVPIRQGARHLVCYSEVFLKTFANPSITKNERERIWKLLKELVSKRYQKKICAMTGAVSPRSDMKPEDHPWLTRDDFLNFFPEPDAVTYTENVLSREKVAIFSTLYEQYRKLGLDRDRICEIMDFTLSRELC